MESMRRSGLSMSFNCHDILIDKGDRSWVTAAVSLRLPVSSQLPFQRMADGTLHCHLSPRLIASLNISSSGPRPAQCVSATASRLACETPREPQFNRSRQPNFVTHLESLAHSRKHACMTVADIRDNKLRSTTSLHVLFRVNDTVSRSISERGESASRKGPDAHILTKPAFSPSQPQLTRGESVTAPKSPQPKVKYFPTIVSKPSARLGAPFQSFQTRQNLNV